MIKIAYCLFGQPRRLEEGHKTITDYLKKFPNVEVDFYYHTWYDETLTHYEATKYRNIPADELKIERGIIDKINSLYKPVAYSFESPKTFDQSIYVNSYMYHNSDNTSRSNFNNLLSQTYSRQKVRDLFEKENRNYDFVFASRFDIIKGFMVNINELIKNRLYVSNVYYPRIIMPDHITICEPSMFLNIFNIYNNLPNLMNNYELSKKIAVYNEHMVFNAEEVLLANYLFYYSPDKIIYTGLLPWFC